MDPLELAVARFSQNHDGTLGALYLDDRFFCFTMEDRWTMVKIGGLSRIPDGRYQIKFREVVSPLTTRYRDKYQWFRWHLELQGVPDYEHVYLHVGNTPEDSDGCILVGDSAENNQVAPAFVGKSTPAFRRLYERVAEALESGREVWITITSIEQQSTLPLVG